MCSCYQDNHEWDNYIGHLQTVKRKMYMGAGFVSLDPYHPGQTSREWGAFHGFERGVDEHGTDPSISRSSLRADRRIEGIATDHIT